MKKVRVYEIAKEFNIKSKELVDALNQVGIEVSSHMSSLEADVANQIRSMLKQTQLGKNNVEQKENDIKEAKEDKVKVNTAEKQPKEEVTKEEKQSKSQPKQVDKVETKEEKEKKAKALELLKSAEKEIPEVIPEEMKSDYTIIKHSESVEEIWEQEIEKEKIKSARRRPKKNKRDRSDDRQQYVERPQEIEIPEYITVGELAKAMAIDPNELIAQLMNLGVMAAINQPVDPEAAIVIGEELGITVNIKKEEKEETIIEPTADPELLEERPPIVTVMGHVDHGKTSLLDQIRNSRVIATEAGGITQHIGAYQTEVNNKKITFLDTPGHAAFTEMRSRGARVTDIVILVVAADDGIMPQTTEAINHSKAADVPIVVAINKCDLPSANPDRVKQELTKYDLVPEEWGGDTICVEISALTGDNIPELLEAVLLLAEMNELKANPTALAQGTVIESNIEKGYGRVATVIVQNGTLRKSESVVVGNYYGKIKTIVSDKGKRIKSAGPSTPIVISGLDGLPEPGDILTAYEDDREAKDIAEQKQQKARQIELRAKSSRMTLDDLVAQMQDDRESHTLNIIVKGDVQGSVEAIKGSLAHLNEKDTRIKFEVIHSGVGSVNETDVMLAAASDALVLGFNVNADGSAKSSAEEESVEMRFYSVIYNLLEDLEAIGKGMLDPIFEEINIGTAKVRATFKVPRIGTIAGCYVTQGTIKRNAIVKLYRDGSLIYEGKISSLKRFQDDVREVASGYECGIGLENFNDIKEEDIIEAYIMKEKPGE
ncbi:MAG: translation initiation factor IF-2 [Clostridia bacterium]